MLEERMIVVGRAYVKEDARTIREVVEELDDRRVRFNAFDLDTGKLTPSRHQTCSQSSARALGRPGGTAAGSCKASSV